MIDAERSPYALAPRRWSRWKGWTTTTPGCPLGPTWPTRSGSCRAGHGVTHGFDFVSRIAATIGRRPGSSFNGRGDTVSRGQLSDRCVLWCREKDLNLRRLCRQIYSPLVIDRSQASDLGSLDAVHGRSGGSGGLVGDEPARGTDGTLARWRPTGRATTATGRRGSTGRRVSTSCGRSSPARPACTCSARATRSTTSRTGGARVARSAPRRVFVDPTRGTIRSARGGDVRGAGRRSRGRGAGAAQPRLAAPHLGRGAVATATHGPVTATATWRPRSPR